MGAGPIGITRDEILTPPEFLKFISTENPSGRVGGARIELVHSNGMTQLGQYYQQIPARIMPPFQLDNESASLLYLINLTAGILDGDAHLIELIARTGTRTVLTGQSATRVHPSGNSFSTQQWNVNVEGDACLVVMPGPTIPYKGCRYYQRARVEMAESARLLWGDIWLPGRYERGVLSERFQFERIVQDFEVRRTGQLLYRDRFCWDGPWTADETAWHFGPHLAVGSLFIGGPLPETLPPLHGSVQRSVFPLDTGSSCVRWCGTPADVTADLVRVTMMIAAQWTSGPHATPWLIHSSELTPNHWFSMP